jgi:hypothetical protein
MMEDLSQFPEQFLIKDRVFPRNNATSSTLRLGRTPRTSGPEIKSKKYDGYQHNLTSDPMTKRRKQSMSPRVKTVHLYLSLLISQTRKIKAASLLQIPAFEELLSLVLNYLWTIMWIVFKMRGLNVFLRKAHSYDKLILNSDAHQHN